MSFATTTAELPRLFLDDDVAEGPPDRIEALLGRFATAPAELLGQRALLSRIDSKFVVPAGRLDHILADLATDYMVVRVGSRSIATYDNLYFDTPTLRCYHDHSRGRRLRHKVRFRHYPDREVSFLEVKSKRNEGVTDKRRMPVPFGDEHLGVAELVFLRAIVGAMADELHPQVAIRYRRITLISMRSDERVTIDLELSASDGDDDCAIVARALGHVAVIEVKQWPFCVRTPIMRAVRGGGHRESSMSKYITVLALMRPELRRNRLLPGLRVLERI